tara:strand:- start:2683 stop:3045 length:363 start_codon:yes stop_codon:yes gene_type:complete
MSKTMSKITPKEQDDWKYSVAHPSPYLGSLDLMGKEIKLTITAYRACGPGDIGANGRQMTGTVLSFKETPKLYVACKTVFLQLQKLGGFEPKSWIGKTFTFYPTTCRLGKDSQKSCIRVK